MNCGARLWQGGRGKIFKQTSLPHLRLLVRQRDGAVQIFGEMNSDNTASMRLSAVYHSGQIDEVDAPPANHRPAASPPMKSTTPPRHQPDRPSFDLEHRNRAAVDALNHCHVPSRSYSPTTPSTVDSRMLAMWTAAR
jgi:hypothetical protein